MSNGERHDALYVALAESLDRKLITADKRIALAPTDRDLIVTITSDSCS